MSKLTGIQRDILSFIKQGGGATNARLAEHFGISYEAIRQQLRQLEAARLVEARKARIGSQRAGRPTTTYVLTITGDHFFPKAYDELAVDLVNKLNATLGQKALRHVLSAITDDKVRQWEAKLSDKALDDRLEALKGIYIDDDPHISSETDGDDILLVERNCPFLNVATRLPALCSVTVSTLSRLLGCRVTREKRFQNGDGKCVFRIHRDRPVNPASFRFAFEEELGNAKK